MAPRRPRYFLIDLLLVIALSGLAFAMVRWAWGLVIKIRTLSPLDDDSFGTFIVLDIAFGAWFITWKVVQARRKAPACVECGRKFLPPKKIDGPAICPRCRQRALSPAGLKKEQTKNLWTGLVVLAILASFLGFGLSDFVAARFDRSCWLALPLLAVGATPGLFAAPIIPYILFALIRNRLFSGEKFAMAHARKVAGEGGEEVELGPLMLWYSGPTDPAPMLLEQMEAVRGRFATMVGEEIEVRGPLRIFCFDRRDAFVAFHRQMSTDLWNYDGIYNPAPARSLTLATEVIRHRPCDTEATARSLFTLALLEQYKGFLPVPWLQAGINYALTAGDGGLDRLNRKMVVSMARGTTLGEELFRFKPGAFFKLLKNWPVHEDHARLSQFIAQSWSLIEYLCGEDATEDRRGRYRAYLKATRRGEPDEAVFQSQFGHGYDRLLEGWRGWVLERGVGTYGPPLPRIRDALTERLIPTVLDRRARIMDRILSIRGMGWAGDVPGADALIGLLRAGGEIPKEEIVWSLEAISGLARGDDLNRWSEWWDGLPQDVRESRGHRADHGGTVSIPSPTSDDA
jgi:hypothetical protein